MRCHGRCYIDKLRTQTVHNKRYYQHGCFGSSSKGITDQIQSCSSNNKGSVRTAPCGVFSTRCTRYQRSLYVCESNLLSSSSIKDETFFDTLVWQFFRRLFRVMDDDRNRKLSFDEFKKGVDEYGLNLSRDEVQYLFKQFDTDHDGSINYEEFLQRLRVGIFIDVNIVPTSFLHISCSHRWTDFDLI
jgi:hypothetical protein